VCHRARIFKLLRNPGIDSKESIPPAWRLAYRCDNPIFRTTGQTGYISYIPGLLKSLKIRAQAISLSSCCVYKMPGCKERFSFKLSHNFYIVYLAVLIVLTQICQQQTPWKYREGNIQL